jgi:hypothetical protein
MIKDQTALGSWSAKVSRGLVLGESLHPNLGLNASLAQPVLISLFP